MTQSVNVDYKDVIYFLGDRKQIWNTSSEIVLLIIVCSVHGIKKGLCWQCCYNVLQREPLLKEFMSHSSYKTPQYGTCISSAICLYGNEVIIEGGEDDVNICLRLTRRGVVSDEQYFPSLFSFLFCCMNTS
jgi:hypothetical protein